MVECHAVLCCNAIVCQTVVYTSKNMSGTRPSYLAATYVQLLTHCDVLVDEVVALKVIVVFTERIQERFGHLNRNASDLLVVLYQLFTSTSRIQRFYASRMGQHTFIHPTTKIN